MHHSYHWHSAWQFPKCLPIAPFDLLRFLKYIMVTTSYPTYMHCGLESSRSAGPCFYSSSITYILWSTAWIQRDMFPSLYSRSQLAGFLQMWSISDCFPNPQKPQTTKQLWPFLQLSTLQRFASGSNTIPGSSESPSEGWEVPATSVANWLITFNSWDSSWCTFA